MSDITYNELLFINLAAVRKVGILFRRLKQAVKCYSIEMNDKKLGIGDKKIKDELITLSSNLGEVAIDSILTDGIFKDIPIISSIISLAKLGKTASDSLLLIRLIKFINSLDLKSELEVKKFKEKYFKNEDYPKIGSKILLILEKADEELKIKWLAKSLLLFLDNVITLNEFLRISSIINSLFPIDVEKIVVFRERDRITSINDLVESYVLNHLYSIGLLSTGGFDGGDVSGKNAGNVFVLNKFGNIFMNHLLE